jgi:ABC-type xylose transport system permease subunit
MRKDILVPVVVIVSALAFIDPFMYLMPSMMVSLVLGVLMVSSVSYALMVYKEGARDEREISLRAFADRIACLVGTTGLVGLIVYQVLVIHHVDTFVVVILLLMIISKYVAHIYAEHRL